VEVVNRAKILSCKRLGKPRRFKEVNNEFPTVGIKGLA
jgi:hypothetical protein